MRGRDAPGTVTRRRRVLFLIVLAAAATGLVAAVWCWRSPAEPVKMPAGMWRPVRGGSGAVNKRQRELEALPYLSGYKKALEKSGVTVHDRELAQPGLNLVFSGHGPEAALIDMQGRVRQRWRMSYAEARRHAPALRPPLGDKPWAWRRGAVLPNGGLLAIFDGFGLIKLDRRSRLVWAFPGAAHHDLFVAPDGTIHVLTRRARVVPRIHPTDPVLLDYVSVLAADGRLLREVALLEAFERSTHAALLKRARRSPKGDLFHTNTVEVLDGKHASRSPVFATGNLLVSLRELDVVAIVDPRAQKVVWAATGAWRRQHDPLMLPGGNLLLFDNLGAAGKARVLELDPLTLETVWEYGGPRGEPLESKECGASHRLANGNTLIVESLAGRALEVTPKGKIVWEYFNPHRAGARRELIATLFDVVRVDPGLVNLR